MKYFQSQKKLTETHKDYSEYADSARFQTAQFLLGDKVAPDVKSTWLTNVKSDLVESGSTSRVIKATAHGVRAGEILRFTNGDNVGIEVTVLSIPDADHIILASKLIDAPSAGEGFDVLRPISPTVNASGLIEVTLPTTDVIDQIDTTPLLDVSSSNIPKSSSNPLEIVASLAANCKEIVSVDDIGEYIGLYVGSVGAETLKCILPIAGGEMKLALSIGDRVSLRHMKDSDIATSTFIAINFLG